VNLDLFGNADFHCFAPLAADGDMAARLPPGAAGILQKPIPKRGLMAEYSGIVQIHAIYCRSTAEADVKLDRYDRAIVRALQLDGRVTNSQLADSVSLSESACLRRVRALEESGFIEGYTALINQQKAGCPVNVFVNITLERQEQAHLHAFEEAARRVPEVMECYLMSGEYDYLLRVVLADTADFERLHSQHLTRLPNVARVHSSFALRTVQKSRELPVR
jgi:Lrp/AsnC family transcriptional regulator, leucine-responsive regulatory protein